MRNEIITFGDIEVEKYKFHQHKIQFQQMILTKICRCAYRVHIEEILMKLITSLF